MKNDSRRDFIKNFTGVLAGGSALSLLPQLKLIGNASAQDAAAGGGAYRALVCVYLSGGSDSFNLLIPTDSARYSSYNTARGGTFSGTLGPLAIADSTLLPVSFANPVAGQTYGLHPACADWTGVDRNGLQTAMPGLQSLTNQGRVAWVANVGTLAQPVTKANYTSASIIKPPQLFSHSDQTNVWFQGRTTANFRYGWGGQVGDLLENLNSQIGTSGATMPINISFSGANRMQVGLQVVPYQMGACGNPNGGNSAVATVGINFANCSGTTSINNFRSCSVAGLNASEAALCSLLNAQHTNLMSAEHADLTKRSMDLSAQLGLNLASSVATNPSLLTTPFRALADDQAITGYNLASDAGNSLAEQLAMVARLIKMRAALGQSRNVFFVSLGGFDTHSAQMADATQPRLLRRLSRALGSFYKALEEMNMQNNVTTFTVSEFGRTLNSNGDGSDHGWGSVSMVMGGSVNGGRLYGSYPEIALNGANSVPSGSPRGQMIPTTSADTVAATLASWMGISQTNLQTIFPNLSNPNFTGTPFNLGFMNPAPV